MQHLWYNITIKNTKKQVKTKPAIEFFNRFSNDDVARGHFEKVVWDGNITCPRCESKNVKPFPSRKGHYCNPCRRPFTAKTNTVYESSKLSYTTILYLIYLVQTSRKGISSLQLSKELGITQKSAWHALHRTREACKSGSIKLDGVVEIDEAYVGGRNRNRHAK